MKTKFSTWRVYYIPSDRGKPAKFMKALFREEKYVLGSLKAVPLRDHKGNLIVGDEMPSLAHLFAEEDECE